MATGAPNIVLVMSDQHRADMMGCAGDASALTPSLDALAAEGVRFSRVSCQGPLCMPARASFMTERYVRDHGVYTNSSEIPPDSPTYAWALREAGYHTALLGKAHLYLDEQALRVPHGRHGRAARGAGVRRGLRDGRQVRREDPDQVHGLPHRAVACSTPTSSTSPTAATRARTKTVRTRPSACRCGTRRRRRSLWSRTSTPGTVSRQWSGSSATTARSRSFSSWGSRDHTILGMHPAEAVQRYRDVDISMPSSTRRPLTRGPVATAALLNAFLWLSDSESMTDDAIRGMRTSYAADISVIDQAVGDMVGALERRGLLGHHLDHLHQRPRRNGRQPRTDVQVRPV